MAEPDDHTKRVQQSALKYRKNGLNCIPLNPKDKRPDFRIFKTGDIIQYQDRQATYEEFNRWFARNTPLNIGILCGKSSQNLVVLDFDDGETFRKFYGENGEKELLNYTYVVASGAGQGRKHVYYRTRNLPLGRKFFKEIGIKIEILSQGNYAVAPPSVHPDTGNEYRQVSSTDEIAESEKDDFGKWVETRILERFGLEKKIVMERAKNGPAVGELLNGVAEGTRNEAAFTIAYNFAKTGIPATEALDHLTKIWNPKNKTPLPENEIRTACEHAYQYNHKKNTKKTPEENNRKIVENLAEKSKGLTGQENEAGKSFLDLPETLSYDKLMDAMSKSQQVPFLEVCKRIQKFIIHPGDPTYYTVFIGGRKLKFTDKEMLSPVPFQHQFFRNFLVTVPIEPKEWGSFLNLLSSKAIETEKRKIEEFTEEENIREVVLQHLKNCVVAAHLEQTIKGNSRIYVNANVVYVPADLIKYVIKSNQLDVTSTKLRMILDPVLNDSTERIRVGKKRFWFWKFEKEKVEISDTEKIDFSEETERVISEQTLKDFSEDPLKFEEK